MEVKLPVYLTCDQGEFEWLALPHPFPLFILWYKFWFPLNGSWKGPDIVWTQLMKEKSHTSRE